jgi:hypothetical protein
LAKILSIALGPDGADRPDLVAVDRLVTFDELWPTRRLISSKIDIAADLVGDTGIEPVTASV